MTAATGFAVGIDLVRVSRIAESIRCFGPRFLNRLFTADEQAYATADPAVAAERLAARFAAKEATRKALRLGDGIGWRQIEVRRNPDGACDLVLHDRAAELAGAAEIALSMSHEGDLATAVVMIRRFEPLPTSKSEQSHG